MLADSFESHCPVRAVRRRYHLVAPHRRLYPTAETAAIDERLSQQMDLIREIASLGRAARMEAKLKVRQPLSGVTVVLNSSEHRGWLEEHDAILKDELNVKSVEYRTDAATFVTYEIQPNFKKLGPKVGKLLPKLKEKLASVSGAELLSQLSASGSVLLNIEGTELTLGDEDIQVRLKANPGWAAAQGRGCVVVLSTELTEGLIEEGIVRDVVRAIQECRKQANLDYSDHIEITLDTPSAEVKKAVTNWSDFVRNETLADSITWSQISDSTKTTADVGEFTIEIRLNKVSQPLKV